MGMRVRHWIAALVVVFTVGVFATPALAGTITYPSPVTYGDQPTLPGLAHMHIRKSYSSASPRSAARWILGATTAGFSTFSARGGAKPESILRIST